MSARLLVYAFVSGVAGALIALALYIPTSGLIELLEPFVGLRLITYCTEFYFGAVLILAAVVFRKQINVAVVFLGVSVFGIANAVGGICSLATSVALQHAYNWTYTVLYGLGAVGFIVALVVAFGTLRSNRDNVT